MENFLLFLFGKKYLFFNVRHGIQASIWITESELAMSKKKLFEKRKEIEEMNAVVLSGKREDGTAITDPKEISLLKDDIKSSEQLAQIYEANCATHEEKLKQERYKLEFVNEYAPKVGRWILLAATVIAVVVLLS